MILMLGESVDSLALKRILSRHDLALQLLLSHKVCAHGHHCCEWPRVSMCGCPGAAHEAAEGDRRSRLSRCCSECRVRHMRWFCGALTLRALPCKPMSLR